MKKLKKSAALLMTMLIVSVVLITALSAMRIVISSVGATSAMSDSIIADEASKGGIEWALIRYKNNKSSTTQTFNFNGIRLDVEIKNPNNTTDPVFSGWQVISDATIGKVQKRHTYQMYPF